MDLWLEVTKYCDHSYHSQEEYGEWEERYSYKFGDLAHTKSPNRYDDIWCGYTGPELKAGDEIYAVFAIYSEGDSFGKSYCGELDIISVNKDLELAKRNMDVADTLKDETNYITINDDGSEINQYAAWSGHFECLEEIKLVKFTVI